jgi:tetratricopeptide (TPR) repeat protein/tRNA A-37 threonylcarbamoyl transferase component Bud32
MTERPHDDRTIDFAPNKPAPTAPERFEAAWQEALRGGAPPSLESFLEQASDLERAAVAEELTRLDREFKQRMAQMHSLQAAAVFRDDAPLPASARTIDFVPGRPRDPEATVDPAGGVVPAHVGSDPASAADTANAVGDPTMGSAEVASGVTVDSDDGVEFDSATGKSTMSPRKRKPPASAPSVAGYEILGELGRGGMGVVYKAKHKRLNRVVALKMVLAGAHAAPEQLARFNSEAESVAQLQHPNIVQIYEVGEHDGLPYFSLEYVEGGSLTEKLAGKPQPFRDAAQLVETLAAAMACAHLHGIIHRDLKPGNVLLTKDGQPKITDFGLAKRLEGDSSQTKSGTLMGTPSYMAPEQARGDTKEIGPLADVYALGVVLYETLTGRAPFIGAAVLDTLEQVRNQEPVPPSRLQPSVPRDLETICLKCLQKEAHKRYASAEALAEDLHRFLTGEPIKARPVGNAERLLRWCLRNPKIATLTAAILFLLIALTVGSTLAAIKISYEHDEAVKARDLADQKAIDEMAARQLADKHAEEARQAETKAAANAKLAGEQRELALETLYSVVTKTEEKLRDKADMLALRQDLVETTMAGLNKVSRSAETAALADRTTGIAHTRMGDICERVSRTEEAIRQYKLSLDIFERGIVQEPDNDQLRYNAAVSCDKLGEMCREMEGDSAVALAYYERSLKLREQLAADLRSKEPTPAERNFGLAVSYVKLATLTLSLGDPVKSHTYAQKALEQGEKLLEENAQSNGAKMVIGYARYGLGKAAFRLGRPDEARKELDECVRIRQQLVDKLPQSAQVKVDLALAHDGLGDIEMESGRADAALAYFAKAHEIHAAVYERDKTDAMMKLNLGNSYYRLATARLSIGQAAAADTDYHEALKFREDLQKADPKNFQRRLELMPTLARCGDHARASQMADEFRQRGLTSPDIAYNVACTYALCAPAVAHGKSKDQLTSEERSRQDQYVAKALDALTQALAHGYKDAGAFAADPDLAPLHRVPAFQEMRKTLQTERRTDVR